jgi:hypothetical protein
MRHGNLELMGSELMTRTSLVLALTAVLAAACNRDAVANQNAEKSPAIPTPLGQQAGTVAKTQFDEPAFSLSIASKAPVDKGQSGELLVVLTAKAPYHVNQEYPHRLKVTATRGLTTPHATIQRDPAKVTSPRLELVVPVTLGQDGPFGLDGEMSFSLCTEEKCLMEKRQLTVAVGPN